MSIDNEIKFFIHGEEHVVRAEDADVQTSLNEYLRRVLKLKGTKNLCLEGGCGSCIVVAEAVNPSTKKTEVFAVNSCLVSILSCHDWKISTVEGIGGPLKGYHKIQETLAKFNGTQCGFCSGGMVMNMYALLESGKLTMKEVENSFGGNICRCTGYRSILDAFKSLCKDADPNLIGRFPDIEDIKVCKSEPGECQKKCGGICRKATISIIRDNAKWYKIYNLKELLEFLPTVANTKYMLVAGHTARGVFKSDYTDIQTYIDITSIPDLRINEVQGDKLILGGNTNLTAAMETFYKLSQENPKFAYFKKLGDHIDLIANVPVRNIGTLAGNLMMKHGHHNFQSDVFLTLETSGAVITIVNAKDGKETSMSPQDFISIDMNSKVIKTISIPSYENNVKYESYKIMPRAQNAHAIVNAGFRFAFNTAGTLDKATIVFGNINPQFIHATEVEAYLVGKNLFDNGTIQGALEIFDKILKPDTVPPDPEPEFRKALAMALFYKAVLSMAPAGKLSPRNVSGGPKLERPLSKGSQEFHSNQDMFPVTKPIPKLEALAQTTGQAEYIDDLPDNDHQLFASFVLAQAPAKSVIKNIDTSKALKYAGVVSFVDAKDIPGENNFSALYEEKEEIFCSGTVLYYHQPVGVVVATSSRAASAAAKLVAITYDPPKSPPLITARDVIKAGATDRIHKKITMTAKNKGTDIKHKAKGSFDISTQCHFHMESHSCSVVPTEDGLDIYPAAQWMDFVQASCAAALKLPNNKINISVRRCGGAFGGKISRNSLISCAAAVAAWKLRKPVKMHISLSENLQVCGKRWPLSSDYEIAVNDKGVIQYLDCEHYSNYGVNSNEPGYHELQQLFTTQYGPDRISGTINIVTTDIAANTWARAPGSTEGLASLEAIMDHVSYVAGIDPLELRMANLKEPPLISYVKDLKQWAEIDKRKQDIAKFNQDNRWKKKGMSVVPMSYQFSILGPFAGVVSVYHEDGTVAIIHGGIEIGQGINTKVAQTCAYRLGIPLEKIQVIPSKNYVTPNNMVTGGSITSEATCYAILKACDELLDRMEPYRDKNPKATWEEIVTMCYNASVNLSASGMYPSPDIGPYKIYGVCACEVLLDILTGQHHILRVDLLEDTGQSISPEIDVGQIEGALIMGLGYHTTEDVYYTAEGQILTNNTWYYHPPGPKDIPLDTRIKFPKGALNPDGVLNSKATAEPPLCLTICIPLAIRNALASARTDSDKNLAKWVPFDGPTLVQTVFMNSANNYKQYVL